MKRHTWMMLACLALPIAVLIMAYGFGITNPIVYWTALLMCPAIHIIMMMSGEKCH